jgi:hypothetical protein
MTPDESPTTNLVSSSSSLGVGSETAGDIDTLIYDFQRACETVVVRGDSHLSVTTKERAILRNALRARLLASRSSSEGSRNEMSGVDLIAAERVRQIESEEDDAFLTDGQLADSALVLLEYARGVNPDFTGRALDCAWKLAGRHTGNPVKLLTISGAFIAAEIDRLQRAASSRENEGEA